MIITEKFILINVPKTGTSFVRDILKIIHKKDFSFPGKYYPKRRARQLLMPNIRVKTGERNNKDQHGIYYQVPQAHCSKEVVSIVRNPVSRLISMYKYGHWKKYPPVSPETLRQRFDNFPDLSFDDFQQMHYEHGLDKYSFDNLNQRDFGPQTLQFILFFACNPFTLVRKMGPDYSIKENLQRDFPKIRFLRTENLNEDLMSMLTHYGYCEKDVSFIGDSPPLNVSSHTSSFELNDQQMSRILQKEKLIFEMFPEYLPPR